MTTRSLGIWLNGERIAELQGNRPGRIKCRYSKDAVERWPANSPVLSCSLPLRRTAQDAWPFSAGLLPEGQHRQNMAALARLPASDVMGLLARFGRDVAGAVIISADDPPIRNPSAEPYTDHDFAEEVGSLEQNPLGLHDDSELSVAGLQDKILLVQMPGGAWARPRNGYPSTHILKVDDRAYPGLVRAEHACLRIAQLAGLSASSSRLIEVEDTECIVVERFDRLRTQEGVIRTHQEDSCQALGINPEDNRGLAKYQARGGPSLRSIAGLLSRWAVEPTEQQLRLLDQVTFTVLIGNADAHGKNIAFLHPTAGSIELAPLYDTVPTMLWPRLRTEAAMRIGTQTNLAAVTVDDVLAEATSWALAGASPRQRIVDVAERVHEVLRSSSINVDTPALAAVSLRTSEFLRSATPGG